MAIPLQQRTVTILTALSEVIQQDIDECDIIFHELSQLNIAQQDILDAGRDLTTPFSGIEQYIERTVTGYSDPYFYKHFRMTRLDFEVLLYYFFIACCKAKIVSIILNFLRC